jgi:hypothetical protein
VRGSSPRLFLESVDPILLGLDRQIQAKSGDLAIPLEHFWIY